MCYEGNRGSRVVDVLGTTLDAQAYPAVSLARLYRERADAENIYDELKNQWGGTASPRRNSPRAG